MFVLKQYYRGCLAHASYLAAAQRAGEAAVVDPQRDVEQYLEDAWRLGCRIAHVFLTQFHADFLPGRLEVRDCRGTTSYVGSRSVPCERHARDASVAARVSCSSVSSWQRLSQ
jgi:hydroxyacylglutathione hydrolase